MITIPTLLILILAIIFVFIVPLVVALFCNAKTTKIISIILLSLFIVALLCGTIGVVGVGKQNCTLSFDFSKSWASKSINWLPYKTDLWDSIINLIMLIPFGIFIYVFLNLSGKSHAIIKVLLLGLILGIIIEGSQFILPISRSVELSDVLYNAISTLFGGLYGALIMCWRNRLQKNIK